MNGRTKTLLYKTENAFQIKDRVFSTTLILNNDSSDISAPIDQTVN